MQTEVECASRVIENAASMARELHLTNDLGRCTTPTRARLAGLVHAVDVDELATCRTSWRLRIQQAATLLGLLRVLSPAHGRPHRRNRCKSAIGVWRGVRLILKRMPLPSPAHGPGRPKCMPSASLTP
jgi:hypothetical protein